MEANINWHNSVQGGHACSVAIGAVTTAVSLRSHGSQQACCNRVCGGDGATANVEAGALSRTGLSVVSMMSLVARRRRKKSHGLARITCVGAAAGSSGAGPDDDLPTDEQLRISLNARLPPGERIRRQMATRTEETLRRADESIEALGIDLDAVAAEREERMRLLPPLSDDGPVIAICSDSLAENGLPSPGSVEAALQAMLPETTTRWFNLGQLGDMSSEDISSRFDGCEAVAVCPSCSSGSDGIRIAEQGFASMLKGLPDSVSRVVLLSSCVPTQQPEPEENNSGTGGALVAAMDSVIFGRSQRQQKQRLSPMRPLENLLTVAERERGAIDAPLYATIVRAMPGKTKEAPQVIAKVPATVRQATAGLRSMYVGGVRSMGDSSGAPDEVGFASISAASFALAFVLRRGVDVNEVTVVGHSPEGQQEWDELMLPLIGPELWRLDVDEPRRALAWVRGWVDFNYCRGANRPGRAMQRAGLKTPVEVRQTLQGICIKFMPPGSRQPGGGFDGLREGGLEILVDEQSKQRPGRIRVRRCSYGWRKKPMEGSERAILSKLRKDWKMAESLR